MISVENCCRFRGVHMIRIVPLRCVELLIVLVLLFAGQTIAQDSSTQLCIRLATGLDGGGYYDIGMEVKKLWQDENLDFDALETNGSEQNLEYLRDGKAEFALAQLNAVVKYQNNNRDKPLSVIRPLYNEYLHIVLRPPFELTGCSGLEGKRVFIGKENSGTIITAKLLLDIMGLSPDQFSNIYAADLDDVLRLFREDSLDIAMHVGTINNKFIRELMESAYCRLFTLDCNTAKRIRFDIKRENWGLIGIRTIPCGTYMGQNEDVKTLAVPLVLVTRPNVPQHIVDMVDSLIEKAIDSVMARKTQGEMKVLDRVNQLDIYNIYDKKYWPKFPSTFLTVILSILPIVAIIGALLLLLLKNPFAFLRTRRSRMIFIAMASTIIICLVCALFIYLIEHNVNENFSNPYETLWSMVLYLTNKLGGREPVTTGGRIFAFFLLLAGAVFVALFTAFFASKMILDFLERTMSKTQKEHYLILNWSNRALEVVRQINSQESGNASNNDVTVISADPELNLENVKKRFFGMTPRDIFKNVSFRPGDPSDEITLKDANILEAKAVLIMIDPKKKTGADEKNIRSLCAIKNIFEPEKNKPEVEGFHVVIELDNIDNSYIVDNIARKFPHNINVDQVAGGQMRTWLLAQATMVPGLTGFYKNLLLFGEDSNELYLEDIPDEIFKANKDVTFAQYAAQVIAFNNGDYPIIPVGFRRTEKVNEEERSILITNPRRQEKNDDGLYYKLKMGDKLLVMAYKKPGKNALPKNLIQWTGEKP